MMIMKIPYSRPGTSEQNKTGNWGVQKPVVDEKKCIKCTICQSVCPEPCISGLEKNPKEPPKFDYEYCKGCGICAQECPAKAITMEMKEK
jgi:pyruvate ferredoxin oxidoreductase delta subunit